MKAFHDLCTQPLPFAPRPFPDELLISWICRLAAANHISPSIFLPDLEHINRYRLNCEPGENIINRLAVMARVSRSTLVDLLLPNQFPNLSLLTFLQAPNPSVISSDECPSTSFPLPFCVKCASEEELPGRSLHWQAASGLLTTIVCPKHGTYFRLSCPGCESRHLTLTWNETRLVIRSLRCAWRPRPRLHGEQAPAFPLGSQQLLFRLQHDIVRALRDQAPSNFWFGTITASQFLAVVDDLFWLLRTPGLSARERSEFTFFDAFSWTSLPPNSPALFYRTRYWHFSAWDCESRANVLIAMASTMLGRRVFDNLRYEHCYPPPSDASPWDWIFPALHKRHARELLSRAIKWPSTIRMKLHSVSAAGTKARPTHRARNSIS
jgi:hypothetical protein